MFEIVESHCLEKIARSKRLNQWDKEDLRQTLSLIIHVMNSEFESFDGLSEEDAAEWIRQEFNRSLSKLVRQNTKFLSCLSSEDLADYLNHEYVECEQSDSMPVEQLTAYMLEYCSGDESKLEVLALRCEGFSLREIDSLSQMSKSQAQRFLDSFKSYVEIRW
jgi:hypothetical protein